MVLFGGLAGCAAPAAKMPVYNPSQTGVIIREQRGEIVGVRDVIIAPPSPNSIYGGPGRRVGTAIGEGAVESVLTGGVPVRAASTIGGIIGGDIGAKADQKMGEELTIRTDNDSVVVIVQERGDIPLVVGERVRILTGANPGVPVGSIGAILRGTGSVGGSTRVERENNFAGDVSPRRGIASARESRQFNQ
jgi:outer membrane lipoprotein SlyB